MKVVEIEAYKTIIRKTISINISGFENTE